MTYDQQAFEIMKLIMYKRDHQRIGSIVKLKHDELQSFPSHPDIIKRFATEQNLILVVNRSPRGDYNIQIEPKLVMIQPTVNIAGVLKPRLTRTKLGPGSYDSENGVLNVNGIIIPIIRQNNKKGRQLESKEARLLRLLFKDVNTMTAGVPMRQIVSVSSAKFGPAERKLAKNYVAEINKKIAASYRGETNNQLIIADQIKVMVSKVYL